MDRAETLERLAVRLAQARSVRSAGHIGGLVYDVSSLTPDEYAVMVDLVRKEREHLPSEMKELASR